MESIELSAPARGGPTSDSPLNAVLENLTNRRRRVLDVVAGADEPVAVRRLAVEVAAAEGDHAADDVPGDVVDRVCVSLRHFELPSLAHVDLLAWDRDAGTVAPTDHPVYDHERFRRLVAAGAELDGVVDCLSNGRRCAVVRCLRDHDGPMREADLVEAVRHRSSAPPEAVRSSLRHVHLPKLEDYGMLVRPDDEFVRLTPTATEREWIDYLLDD